MLRSHWMAPHLLSPGDQVLPGGAERVDTKIYLSSDSKTEAEWAYGSLPLDVYRAEEKPNEEKRDLSS
jgi:hypothetical protein